MHTTHSNTQYKNESSTVKWAQWDKTQSTELLVCSYVCASHCAQLLHTILHRTDLIVFPLTLQTITTAEWQRQLHCFGKKVSLYSCLTLPNAKPIFKWPILKILASNDVNIICSLTKRYSHWQHQKPTESSTVHICSNQDERCLDRTPVHMINVQKQHLWASHEWLTVHKFNTWRSRTQGRWGLLIVMWWYNSSCLPYVGSQVRSSYFSQSSSCQHKNDPAHRELEAIIFLPINLPDVSNHNTCFGVTNFLKLLFHKIVYQCVWAVVGYIIIALLEIYQ